MGSRSKGRGQVIKGTLAVFKNGKRRWLSKGEDRDKLPKDVILTPVQKVIKHKV